MKFCLCIETFYPKIALELKLKKIREAGFKCIELWSYLDKNINVLFKSDLQIVNFSANRKTSLIYNSKEEILDEIKQATNFAKKINCPNLMILSDKLEKNGSVINYGNISKHEKLLKLYKNLTSVAEFGEKNKINFLLEVLNTKIDHPGYFLNSWELAKSLVKEISSHHLKLLFDIYHIQISEGDIIRKIKEDISIIGHIHIADNPGRGEPGTGEINFEKIFEVLEELNYRGYIGYEFFPKKKTDDVLKSLIKR